MVSRRDDPIAIIGMACRFPGGITTPKALWRVVGSGEQVSTPLPDDRGWDLNRVAEAVPGRDGHRGAYLLDADWFDAGFFGVSPREATAMDPQQRVMLEITWEALERARVEPASLSGTRTGVFTGSSYQDYAAARLINSVKLREEYASFLATGSASSVIAGRVAYSFGFEGPAITVDTACSSSLVALHLACQSLRTGECELAMAGGVTIMPTPVVLLEFAARKGLAADGRIKAFAASADGTVFSEGAAVLVLEPLHRAQAAGRPVLAVVRGSATNQDGTSNGLTAPNSAAQRRLIRDALTRAALAPCDVDVLEAHGTGTPLGDAIELQAVQATYGTERPADRPLLLGTVKPNLGHTQAAAGIAGVMKVVLALVHDSLPRTLNVDQPATAIEWDEGVSLLTEERPWRPADRPRRAAVSSFGVSGTNAHVILEEPPPSGAVALDGPSPRSARLGVPFLWPLSGKSSESLTAQAGLLRTHLWARPDLHPADVGLSLGTTRTAFPHRAVVIGSDSDELLRGLDAVIAERPLSGVLRGTAIDGGGPAFVVPGHGWQWPGMAAELVETAPPFAQELHRCAEAFAPYLDWSLLQVVRGEPTAPRYDRLDVVQPMLFAVSVSIAALWRSHGVEPTAVIGHSQGEVAAAYIAGALDLDDAARLVARRGQLLSSLAGRGGLLWVSCSAEQLAARLDGSLSVAAVNSPNGTVVSGVPQELEELSERCQAAGLRTSVVPIEYAAHSAQIEPLRGPLLEAFQGMRTRRSAIPCYSTVTGDLIETTALDAEYWYRNLRQTVRFRDAIRSMLQDGFRTFVEVSAQPVLALPIQDTADSERIRVATIGSLRRGQGGLARMAVSLGEAFVQGTRIDWSSSPGSATSTVDLPTYAFQRKLYRAPTVAFAAGPGTVEPVVDSATGEEAKQLREQLADSTDRERDEALTDIVRVHLAEMLGYGDPGEIAVDTAFVDLGTTSTHAVELSTRLSTVIGVAVPPTTVFDFPTTSRFVTRLRELMFPDKERDDHPGDADVDELDAEALLQRAFEYEE
jgi:acyl transferase domain-containing protein